MSNPILESLGRTDKRGRPLYRLVEPYSYQIGPGCKVTVPAGYITNFGTIPRLMWWWISPGQLGRAAIVHDYLCNEEFGSVEDPIELYSGFSRWMADAVLYEMMAAIGFGWCKRFGVWAAVRCYALACKARWPRSPGTDIVTSQSD